MHDISSRSLDLFSPTYAIARSKFLGAASARGLVVDSHVLDLPGAEGETLAVDVVLDGPADASKMLIVLSGVHGVEGFCGSAVQIGLLTEDTPMYADTAILHVHAINPYGFSHLRRVTQENVDLNRNFVDFTKPLPVNTGYAEIHNWLLPATWPPGVDAEAELAAYRTQHGARGLQRAIGLGQYIRADGMFFGGSAPTWSNRTFRSILKRYTRNVKQLASIDIHTGLGPSGVGERIFASLDQNAKPRARQWWGELTDVHTGTSTSIPLTGPIQTALFEECPQAEQIGICLEYGTYPSDRVTSALRAEHWLHRHGSADPLLAQQIKCDLKEAFYPNADDWKHDIWRQGRQACLQAIKGLQADCSVET
ncbi:M14 family metallopeptidase [Bradyrhizobium sp. 41S5]|uniref:M14 family metallopeptidase n=1 Tax=Bradyrhizobium sp. 41S5 TaxID=1404443 RepID=UPI00156AE5E0|nr:M14 family metallopeptidase [Bradyrhizobium sp. 41S5]UFX45690.1 M14 family metallopeptidase [Bradyrhizobium sp. 41S5]